MRLVVPCGLVLGAAVFWTGAAVGETLDGALAKAYAGSPELRDARADLRAVDERVSQALSGWRPSVSVSGSGGVERSDSGSTTSRPAQHLNPVSGTFQVVQPLYSGGKTEAGIRQADNEILAGRSVLRSTEQTVLLGAVQAYMDVLRDQARLQLTKNNEEVLQRQLEATQDRFDVGEVTRTDVAQAEARLARAKADRLSAEGQLAVSGATYERVIGEKPVALEAAPPLPSLPASLRDALQIGLAENPDLEAANHSERAARAAVRVAFGELLPSLDLEGRVSRSHETALEGQSSEDEALLARLTVPLYQSGVEHSRVREAKERRNQRRIQIEQARRQVVEQVTQAWETLTSTRSNITAREQEVRANEIALEGVREEAQVGSRTTLDVLDAEQELLDARVALVEAQRDEYVAGFSLLSAVGRLSVRSLGVPVESYDPVAHYDKVRNKWWGWETPE